MLTLYRQKLTRALRSIPTVVCVALLMSVASVLLMRFNLAMGTSSFTTPLFYHAYAAALLLPAIVLLSMERMHARGEAAYLSALPLSSLGIQFAHTLVFWTLLVLSALPWMIAPLLFNLFGTVNFASAYTAILGYLLFGGIVIAVTQAASVSFPHRAARIGVSYGVTVCLMLLGILPSYLPMPVEGIRAVSGLSPLSVLEGFLYGQIFWVGLVYALLVCAACLLIATLAYHIRRGGCPKAVTRAVASAALALAICLPLALGALSQYLPRSIVYLDVTGSETFTVSGKTRDYLRTLDEDVTVYYLCEGGARNAYRNLEVFLKEYTLESDRVRVEYVDTAEDAAFASRYTTQTLNDHSLIVESEKRHYVIDSATFYHYYNATLDQNFSSQYYTYCLDAADYYASTGGSIGSYDEASVEYGSALYLYADQTTAYFDGDALLTNAILYVTGDATETVYVLCGKDAPLESNLRAILTSNGYFFKDVTAITSLEGCDLLLIHSPSRDLSEEETATLASYMDRGGKLLLATSCAYDDYPNLLTVTNAYGLDVAQKKNMVCQKDASGNYTTSFYASVDTSAPASNGFSGSFAMLVPHLILLTPTDGVTHTEWITTTAMGSFVYSNEVGDDATFSDEVKELLDVRAERQVCGAIAQKGDSTLIWISSALSMGLTGYSYSGGGNYALISSALDFATDNEFTALSIDPAPIESQAITPTAWQSALFAVVVLALIAAFALPTGISIYVRKKR
ncbi:MAG: Gldg family protein [Clostridia bacterium]|nr:Gldg family protein [Clostridia bacterium]